MKRAAILLLTTLMATGCASLGPMTPPDVALVDIQFTDVTVFETSGEITVRLSNENQEPLAIDGAVFKLFLNGREVGKALFSERMEIPRLGTSTQQVALHVSNVALVARLAQMLEQPELDYRIRSKLFVERPYGTRRVKSDHHGTFSFDEVFGDAGEQLTGEELTGG